MLRATADPRATREEGAMEAGSVRRLVVGISGASGTIYGVRLLQVLQGLPGIETHLVMSPSAKLNVRIETDWTVRDVEALATCTHDARDIGASIASGSFRTIGMVVAPCSMKTLSSIVHSYADNLLTRAADVVLKEQRRLVVMPRESPLHAGHCRLLLDACTIGAVIVPPMPAFYSRPATIDDLVNHTVGRILDLYDIDSGLVRRWSGVHDAQRPAHVER
jgi:4-hydroxy-3-polyprenylbenzoate decarboxylase